jgi:hypothetical protein
MNVREFTAIYRVYCDLCEEQDIEPCSSERYLKLLIEELDREK